jgi:2,5-diamino-6-(ribosylamino)-4(3H)-pyrimidinone 5'-phosphate reductase
LSTKTEKRLEKIRNLLERLEKQSTKGIPIVVEGRNDVLALHRLGIAGDLILAKTSGKSFLDVLSEIEKTGKPEIILLFDFDRRGKEWTSRLTRRLEGLKITPNLVFWRMLLGLVGRDVKDIEGLASFLETLENKAVMS